MKRLFFLLAALSACQPATEAPTAQGTTAEAPDASVPALAMLASGETLTSSVVLDGDTKRLVVTHADGAAPR